MNTILDLVKECPTKKIKAGGELITEGNRATELYILTKGSVDVLKDDVRVCQIKDEGTIIGEIAALLGLPHMATVRARENSTFKVVREARPFLTSNPQVFRQLAETLAYRLESTTSHLANYQNEFLKVSRSVDSETTEPAAALRQFREYWRESWKLFERRHYQDAGLECETLSYHQFGPEDIILEQDSADGRVYILRTGSVEVLKDDVSLFMIWDGGVLFGEVAALLGTAHTTTVKALEPCTMQVVDDIQKLFEFHVDIAWYICALLAKRLLDVNKYFSGLMQNFDRVRTRVDLDKKSTLQRCMSNCRRGLHRRNLARRRLRR